MPQPIAAPSRSPQPRPAIVRDRLHSLVRSLPRPVGGDPDDAMLERIEVVA